MACPSSTRAGSTSASGNAVTHFGTLAWQKSVNNIDVQLAAYSRYTDLQFRPDPIADLMFNGVASDVFRRAFANGIQGDGAYHFGDWNTVRTGFYVQAEQTKSASSNSLLPIDTTDRGPLPSGSGHPVYRVRRQIDLQDRLAGRGLPAGRMEGH